VDAPTKDWDLVEIDPTRLPHQSVYKILTGSVVPRPIGWVSTLDARGRRNLAPFSFFNLVCPDPPTLLFCPSVRGADNQTKDTLNNIRETGEFVVNIVTEDTLEAMNASAIEAPAEFDEFTFAGVHPVDSVTVKPPRVKESPIHLECRLRQILEISNKAGGGSIVIGTIIHMHLEERVMLGSDKINLDELKPVGRLMGNGYCRISDRVELTRPKSLLGGKT